MARVLSGFIVFLITGISRAFKSIRLGKDRPRLVAFPPFFGLALNAREPS